MHRMGAIRCISGSTMAWKRGREVGVRGCSADEEIARVSRNMGFPCLRIIRELTPKMLAYRVKMESEHMRSATSASMDKFQ